MSSALPLEGRRVVVTRGVEKGDRLNRLLELAGATVVAVPLIATERLAAHGVVQAAVARLHAGPTPGWVVFGSETAVRLVVESAGPALRGLNVAAVGPATAAALRALGLDADLVAAEPTSDGLARDLPAVVASGARVLVIAADGGRLAVGPAMAGVGADLETVVVYRSIPPPGAAAALAKALAAPVDAIVFTSASTVRHAEAALHHLPRARCLAACIGPPTAASATAAGWPDVVVADRPTPEAMVETLVRRLQVRQPLP